MEFGKCMYAFLIAISYIFYLPKTLMNLLIKQESAKNEEIQKLTNEIKRLKRILKYNR